MFSDALTMGPFSRHSMAKQARLNNLLLKTLPLFCPIMAELLSNLKALVQRLFRYLLFRDFAFAFENLSTLAMHNELSITLVISDIYL